MKAARREAAFRALRAALVPLDARRRDTRGGEKARRGGAGARGKTQWAVVAAEAPRSAQSLLPAAAEGEEPERRFREAQLRILGVTLFKPLF